MTVYQNAARGNRWVYDFQANKKRHAGYCVDLESGRPARNEREAKANEAAVRAAVKIDQNVERSGIRTGAFTLAQALALHISSQVSSTPEHVANLKLYAREIVAYFKPETPVTKIGPRINAYRIFCKAQRVKIWAGGTDKRRDRRDPKWWKEGDRLRSAASCNHYLDCLRGALSQAHKAKHPVTGQPMLPFPPTVEPLEAPKRKPTPIPDTELATRLKAARPWTRDAAQLARFFGLRMDEAARVTIQHVDAHARCLRFRGDDQKSNRDEEVYGGAPGWALVERLVKQARSRGQKHLVTWPGPGGMSRFAKGLPIERSAWRPLKSVKRSWRTSGKGLTTKGHRFHDVRARYITHMAGSASASNTRKLARHRDQSTTDRYIEVELAEAAEAANIAMRRRRPQLRVVAGGKR